MTTPTTVTMKFPSLDALADWLDERAEENFLMAAASPTKKAQREGKAYARGIEFAASVIRDSKIGENA